MSTSLDRFHKKNKRQQYGPYQRASGKQNLLFSKNPLQDYAYFNQMLLQNDNADELDSNALVSHDEVGSSGPQVLT